MRNSPKWDPGDRGIYRNLVQAPDLVQARVVVKESDILVLSDREIAALVKDIVISERDRLERYIAANPGFLRSLVPLAVTDAAPRIVRLMAEAARAAGVGPMAAVAGAICEVVAAGVGAAARELILENGGDIYIAPARERVVGIYSGEEGGGGCLALRVRPDGPRGICTSSGRIGHSLSLGDAAAATVVAHSCALADAAATAVGNRVRGPRGVSEALAAAREIPGVLGVVVVRDGRLGAWGDVELA